MVKHLIANNFETERTGDGPLGDRRDAVDVQIEPRALHEVYLAPFKKLLMGAGAWSVMGSYNRLNGVYACQNPELIGVLKGQWEWPGFVAPDFMFAVRDPLAAVLAGLDIPGLDGAAGRSAETFRSGAAPEERLNDIVRRILHAMFAAGLFDNPSMVSSRPASTAEHVAVAEQVATAGTVLLTNSRDLLPLKADRIRQIAVIGPSSHDAIYIVGGSGGMTLDPACCITPLRGIADRAGAAIRVAHGQGSWGMSAFQQCPRPRSRRQPVGI